MAVHPAADGIELRTTPLIGESHVIARDDHHAARRNRRADGRGRQHLVDPDTPAGTYRGYVYALWDEKPVALGALELRVPDRPDKPEVPLTTDPSPPGSE